MLVKAMLNRTRLGQVPLTIGLAFLGLAMTAGAAPADDLQMCVCHVVAPDGGSEFVRVDTPDVNKARRVARAHVVETWGISDSDAKKLVRQCIPPGGQFGDPKLREQWGETPL